MRPRITWVLSKAPFASRRARLRGAWHIIMRGYRCEICIRCGRPVGPHTGSWWSASDDLWAVVIGDPHRVVCPPCFTDAADARGVRVCWKAAVDAD